jgi:hypothetical protein
VTEEHFTGENTERIYTIALFDFSFTEGIDKMGHRIQILLVVSFISFIRNSLTYYKMCYILKFGTIH